MSTSAWGRIVDDTVQRILDIAPTADPSLHWRVVPRGRKEGEGGTDREFVARRWSPAGAVNVFGGGEDQLGRDLDIEVWYLDSDTYEDRRHSDEQDLVKALESASTYPTPGAWGSLKVRRLVRESISTDDRVADGHVRVTFPVRLIWREPAQHI